ncbi:acetoacetate decarboxylase family protein [Amycolatopsis cynarae]|uniref:Acetoacetate decarboxylase family protein n=1 Tax=Amycolatopsis cynarae TaxID=2995223 RepID=A0ABY7B3M9_9PSEU|nr:acetoacetate decarboxylase family protein [Amycolatopsis sp. HUAS 11-8]WAL66902.1 acetoacetate decarboxylase family protein [Amycolatopsis sp. HUAS 11-8]
MSGEVGYPDEPWDLCGHGYVSLWLVPEWALPELPPGVRPVTVAGRAVVGTAFVDYLPGGLLPYHEVLAAVMVRRGARFGLSITDIWVDSPASRAGGRELWGIPKELAAFGMAHGRVARARASEGDTLLAEAEVRSGPVGLRMPFPVVGTAMQMLRGALARTPIRARGRLSLAKSAWRFGGRLGWLNFGRPLGGIAVRDFEMRFGPRHH